MAVGKIQPEESVVADGLKFVHTTSSILGRKRVVLSKTTHSANFSSALGTPPKMLSRKSSMGRSNRLEALPQDILIKILCKVDHSDLKQLPLVSKIVNRASLRARDLHFAFSTPSSKKPVFKRQTSLADSDCYNSEEEVPDAPRRQRRVAKSRLNGVKLSSIAVALFPSSGSVAEM